MDNNVGDAVMARQYGRVQVSGNSGMLIPMLAFGLISPASHQILTNVEILIHLKESVIVGMTLISKRSHLPQAPNLRH